MENNWTHPGFRYAASGLRSLTNMIRKLAFACALLITACASHQPPPHLVFDFAEAQVSIFAVNVGNFREVRFEGDQPGKLTGKSAFIRGAGSISIGNTRIKFDGSKVEVNGKPVRADARTYSNYILYPDGRMEEGFIRSFE